MSNRHEQDEQARETSEAHAERADSQAASEQAPGADSFIAQFARSLTDQLRRRGADRPGDRSARLLRARRGTFAALSVANYRRYLAGQALSMIGTWMQATAQSWLVLSLTHSSTALGVVVALQTLPLLLLAPYGGVIADRLDKRRLLIALQTVMGAQALILGVLSVTGSMRVWQVGLLAAMLGINTAFANPVEQSFTLELVGSEHLRNAVTLNGVNGQRGTHPRPGGRRDPARHRRRLALGPRPRRGARLLRRQTRLGGSQRRHDAGARRFPLADGQPAEPAGLRRRADGDPGPAGDGHPDSRSGPFADGEGVRRHRVPDDRRRRRRLPAPQRGRRRVHDGADRHAVWPGLRAARPVRQPVAAGPARPPVRRGVAPYAGVSHRGTPHWATGQVWVPSSLLPQLADCQA